jgi:hypothetical protein
MNLRLTYPTFPVKTSCFHFDLRWWTFYKAWLKPISPIDIENLHFSTPKMGALIYLENKLGPRLSTLAHVKVEMLPEDFDFSPPDSIRFWTYPWLSHGTNLESRPKTRGLNSSYHVRTNMIVERGIFWPAICGTHVFSLIGVHSSSRMRWTTLDTTLRHRLLISRVLQIPSFSSSK